MDFNTFTGLVDSGTIGVQKIVAEACRRSVWRSVYVRDLAGYVDNAVVNQWVEDAASMCLIRLLERIGEYSPDKGMPSTWINHICWFITANFVRDECIPNMTDMHIDAHADRGGSSRQQATDRAIYDYADACVQNPPESGMESKEDRSWLANLLWSLNKRDRTIVYRSMRREAAKAIGSDDWRKDRLEMIGADRRVNMSGPGVYLRVKNAI